MNTQTILELRADLIVIKLGNGNILTIKADIAECMNEYFTSVLTTHNNSLEKKISLRVRKSKIITTTS